MSSEENKDSFHHNRDVKGSIEKSLRFGKNNPVRTRKQAWLCSPSPVGCQARKHPFEQLYQQC